MKTHFHFHRINDGKISCKVENEPVECPEMAKQFSLTKPLRKMRNNPVVCKPSWSHYQRFTQTKKQTAFDDFFKKVVKNCKKSYMNIKLETVYIKILNFPWISDNSNIR